MYLLDTNLLIRFLTNDDAKKSSAVYKLLKSATPSVYLSDVLISETIWVLKLVYKLDKEMIIDKIKIIISLPSVKCNKDLILKALDIYFDKNVSWIDSYFGALKLHGKYKGIYSYDQGLDCISNIN